jgi:pimeloyl-ACP methyl ester carboxylesterase
MNRVLAALALGAGLSFPLSANAAPRTIQLDAATATVTGSGTRAVLLLPGLGCGPYEFDGIAPALAQTYTVYSLRFAGFDGAAPVKGPYLDAFAKSVTDLIAREHLQKPILIGHSLGGHLALRVAASIPSNVAGVLAIDAVPLFPLPQPGETPETRRKGAAAYRDALLAVPDDAYAAQAKLFIAQLVTAPENVALVAQHNAASDRATIAGASFEMAVDDLGPSLARIGAPIEVLAPAPDEAQAKAYAAFYTGLYQGAPHVHVDAIAPSKHFIMYDQPEKFAAAVNAFLAALNGP